MNWLLQWQTKQTSRRRFLHNSLVTVFGVFAALAIGQHDALATCGNKCIDKTKCSGPHSSGPCLSANCYGGWGCQNAGATNCSYVTGFCESGSNCWTFISGTACKTCCDCYCTWSGGSYYCYCGPA